MKIGQVLDLLEETGMSPEQLSERIRVSGMTVRRWMKKSRDAEVPPLYVPAIRQGCYELLAQGKLPSESAIVQSLLAGESDPRLDAAIRNLGLEEQIARSLDPSGANPDHWLLGLSQIGSNADRQAVVHQGRQKIQSFKKLGEAWSERISTLWEAIRSREISGLEKLVAYGALFYLITPFDLIPDSIPIYGLLDDFAVLGIAASYYAQRAKS